MNSTVDEQPVAKKVKTNQEQEGYDAHYQIQQYGNSQPLELTLGGTAHTSFTETAVARVGHTENSTLEQAPADTSSPAYYIHGVTVTNKHDEKWNDMYRTLQDYKRAMGDCNVPQNYKDSVKLGRWAHYQRIEYWLFLKEQGAAKITEQRIDRLREVGFEWDPQRAHWDSMFQRLVKFKLTFGHCQVSKNYKEDKELANWVRNQRLENANLKRSVNSRMTGKRQEQLDSVGFIWSKPSSRRACPRQESSVRATEIPNCDSKVQDTNTGDAVDTQNREPEGDAASISNASGALDNNVQSYESLKQVPV